MRLKDYGRSHKKRKEYVDQLGLLLIGVDISKAKHDACTCLSGGRQVGMLFMNGSKTAGMALFPTLQTIYSDK
jgi:hypothetical protein